MRGTAAHAGGLIFIAEITRRISRFFLRPVQLRGIVAAMGSVTQILSAIEQGDPQAADKLLPLVYEELRKLATQRLGQEKPGQTLPATALVHEAYLRLVDQNAAPNWNSRGHFFAAAAEAMRRILVEAAQQGQRQTWRQPPACRSRFCLLDDRAAVPRCIGP